MEASLQIAYLHKISDTEMHANGLLDSAEAGHIKPSDRSAVKKSDDSYQGEGCPHRI